MKKVALLLLMIGCGGPGGSQEAVTTSETVTESEQTESEQAAPTPAEPTELSQKAARLTLGMDKTEVIALLGPPTWAIQPGDASDWAGPEIPLALLWRNGVCSPVAVNFGPGNDVAGWDEGRALCEGTEYIFAMRLECSQPERRTLCQ